MRRVKITPIPKVPGTNMIDYAALVGTYGGSFKRADVEGETLLADYAGPSGPEVLPSYAPPVVATDVDISIDAFIGLFSKAQIKSITKAAKTNEDVDGMLTRWKIRTRVMLSSAVTTEEVEYLETLGVIAAGEAQRILGGFAP